VYWFATSFVAEDQHELYYSTLAWLGWVAQGA
jgi:hypothetical protein